MATTELTALAAWESFYVIVGSSCGALTGLVFVVVTLMPESRRRSATSGQLLAAFAAPTVSHLVAGLMVSAIVSVPWRTLWHAGIALSLSGVIGALYCAVIFRRIRRQSEYRPMHEDWLWFLALPLLAYAALLLGGILLLGEPRDALFVVAGAVLLLLFVGIHNAWDIVTSAATVGDAPPPPPSSS